MESQITDEKKENKGLYWMITIVSLISCVALIAFAPEWFWLTLPFLFTYFVKAVGMM